VNEYDKLRIMRVYIIIVYLASLCQYKRYTLFMLIVSSYAWLCSRTAYANRSSGVIFCFRFICIWTVIQSYLNNPELFIISTLFVSEQ